MALVPRIWHAEIASGRLAGERRKRIGFPYYDSVYRDLAVRERLPLATVDTALARAAQAVGVTLT
jgi:predicted nucleic acid-binding protein